MPTYASNLPEFEPLKRRVQSQFAQQKSESDDAMKRRFAAGGMLGSGAYQKLASQSEQEFAQKQNDALSNVDLAEQSEIQRRKEITEGRDFARGEREASQGFARGEREASQGFAQGERVAGQAFSKGMFDTDMAFKQKLANNEDYWRKMEFGESVKANDVNAIIAMMNTDRDPEDFGQYRNVYQSFLNGTPSPVRPRPQYPNNLPPALQGPKGF